MYQVAGSRLRALKRNASETGVLGAATRLANTAIAKPSSGGSKVFGWLTGGSQKLPSLELRLEGVTLPPPLPVKVEAGETRITTLPNGVKIASKTSPNPAAYIGLYIECGSVYETPASLGVTHLLERMAFKSTANWSHLRLVREVEAIGGNVTTSASREQMGYTYDALKTYMPEMVEVLINSVGNPTFLDWEVNEQLQKVKAEIGEISINPQGLLLESLHSARYSGALVNPLMAPESAINRLNSDILEDFVAVVRALAYVEMKNMESAYQAWLGYYNSNKMIGRDKYKLVLLANEFSRSIKLENPPAIAKLVLRKMGLNNVLGLRAKSASRVEEVGTP